MAINYICFGCAAMYGGESPDNHVCTVHEDNCDNCDSRAILASVDDWDWPKGKPKKWQGAGRD